MAGEVVLQAEGLQKAYGRLVAVQHLSLTLKAGQILGLLGPNGAGKTTTIAMLSGLLPPDRGKVLLLGRPFGPWDRQRKALIGLVPQDLALYPTLTGEENLTFFGRLYGLRGRVLRQRVAEALDWVGLTAHARRPVATYSGGMKRRLNLAAAVLHRPRVLFLDEPTVGVDPQSRNAIFERVEELARQGTAILYTTHYMEEAQRLCHRVAIMDRGRILAEDTPQGLIQRLGGGVLRLAAPPSQLPRLQTFLQSLPQVRRLTTRNGLLVAEVEHPQQTLQQVLDFALRHQVRLSTVDLMEASLEAVFLALTGKSLRDGEA